MPTVREFNVLIARRQALKTRYQHMIEGHVAERKGLTPPTNHYQRTKVAQLIAQEKDLARKIKGVEDDIADLKAEQAELIRDARNHEQEINPTSNDE